MENNTFQDDDFVRYVSKTNQTKKSCCSWKLGCILTGVSWAVSTIALVTTIGLLYANHYVLVEFQNPHHQQHINATGPM